MTVIPDTLSPRTKRHLAHALLASAEAAEEVQRQRRLELTEEGTVKLASILMAGSKPTVGFYRRYRVMDHA
jgi:hypothetical protein